MNTSSSLEVNMAKTKILIGGHNKRKLNQETIYLDKDQIEITHENIYLGINFIHMGTWSHLVKDKKSQI